MKARTLPNIPLTDAPEGYAPLVAQGWDTIQEAFNMVPGPQAERMLSQAKREAESKADAERGEGIAEIELGGERFQVAPHGARGGKKYVLANDDFMIMVGSSLAEWQISVRYLSAGLWEHGAEALHHRAYACLDNGGFLGTDWKRDDEICRVSRADYAFDFHSPAFSAEMRPALLDQVVCHAEVKKRGQGKFKRDDDAAFDLIGTSARLETLTLGARGSLQIQVYDKTTEIIEASGKEWMRDLWARPDGLVCERDVWRVEVRMWKDWLRERGVKTNWNLFDVRSDLLADALWNRRLCTDGDGDSRLRRRPVHPLWSLAIKAAGEGVPPPLGRTITMRREELRSMLVKQAAGVGRALSVLATDDLDADQLAADLESAKGTALTDSGNARKVAKLQERYRNIDEAT